jgi:hypothetical protein
MNKFKNYYLILGILPSATQNEIVAAYRYMAKKYHPDVNKRDDATELMQLITEAYNVLKDAEKRKIYNIKYDKYIIHITEKKQKKEEVKVEKCYYCGNSISNNNFSYKETFYKETRRIHFPRPKVWYETVTVNVPRCESCYVIHHSGSSSLVLLPLIAFTGLGLTLGLTIWGNWFIWLCVGASVGGIIGKILSSAEHSIITKEAGIKEESDIDSFNPVTVLYDEGWTTEQPSA